MKKLNKKGFTLVELLAVIVILAVIMVITIPTVLGSMGAAKTSAFKSALKTIEEFGEKQLSICNAGISEFTGSHDTTIAVYDATAKKCVLKAATASATAEDKSNLVTKAGYTGITIDTISEANGNVSITKASSANTSEFGTQSIG